MKSEALHLSADTLSAAEPKPMPASLLSPIAFLVDRIWAGRLPAGPNGSQGSIEERCYAGCHARSRGAPTTQGDE